MDTMLIRWIIVLFGISVGSVFTEGENPSATSKNDTSDSASLNFGFKPKRELDDFDFDASTFDTSASIFQAKNINGLTSFDDDDISGFLPSFKVTRSNSQNLGTHNQNFDSSNFPSSNFRADSQQAQSSEAQTASYSNEDQDALSQVRQSNTAFNNQLTTPYFDGYINQPKYVAAKSSAFPGDNVPYKPPAKVQFNGYPPLTEYTTSSFPIYSPLTQVPIQAAPQNQHYQVQQSPSHNLPYKQFSQGFKNIQPASKSYAPLHSHNQQQQQQQQQRFDTQFQNAGQNTYDNIQFTTTPTVEINGKKVALPVLQLQTTQPFPYIQALETTPVIFSAESGLQYKAEPGFGVAFDFSRPKHVNSNQRSGNNAPFLDSLNTGPIQVLPVQTASSTAQFPKYKGASVAQYPSRGFSKIPNDYQDFKSQAQLHFDGKPNIKPPKTYNKPASGSNKPLEQIRSDVEVIDKKKPIPPLPKGDDDDEERADDDDSGEGYKSSDSYFPKNDDDDDDAEPIPRKFSFKDSELEGDFKPSKSYPFKNYDTKFNKQKTTFADDDDQDDEEPTINLAAKYRYLAKSDDDDDDDEDDSSESKPQSKFLSYPVEEKFKSYRDNDDDDDENEEETRKQERREKISDGDQSSRGKTKPRKDRVKSYAEEFEETFRRKNNKPKQSHHRSKVSNNHDDRRSRSNFRREESGPSKTSAKKNRHRTYRDETGESSPRSRSAFRSDESSSSKLSPRNIGGKSAQVIWEESYGLRPSSTEKDVSGRTPSYSKEEAAVTESHTSTRKPNQEYPARPSHKSSVIPVKESIPFDLTETSTFNPRGNWKSTGQKPKTKPIPTDSYSRPVGGTIRALVHAKTSYYNPEFGRGQIFRGFKGI